MVMVLCAFSKQTGLEMFVEVKFLAALERFTLAFDLDIYNLLVEEYFLMDVSWVL